MKTKLNNESLKVLCQASFSCREEMQHLTDLNMNLHAQCGEFASDLKKYKISMAIGPNEDKFYSYQFGYHENPTLMSSDVFFAMMNEKRMALVTTRLEIEDNNRKINELDRLMELYDEDAIAFGTESEPAEPTPEVVAHVEELPTWMQNPFRDLLKIKTRILVKDIACDVQEVFLKVQEIVVSLVNVEPQQVEADTFLHDDVGMDDLDFVDLILCLQEEFDCYIRTADVHGWRTVGDVVRTVMNNSKVAH